MCAWVGGGGLRGGGGSNLKLDRRDGELLFWEDSLKWGDGWGGGGILNWIGGMGVGL